MGQPNQGWTYGAGPMPGMSQARPPMSGFPGVLQSSLLQQQQQQQQQQPPQQQQQNAVSQHLHQHGAHQEILDMSDFPALGSVNNASSNPGLSAASYASTAGTLANTGSSASGNGLSQEFSIEDDFPALPGARPNSAGSGRHFGSMQLHQQQQQSTQQGQPRSQQNIQHHPSQQQAQHLLQQSQLDGMGAFSSMISPSSGSQMQQSMQLQQQLANDLMFQQQHQLLHMNGSHSPINAHLSGSSNELAKATKSYATKAGNGSGLFLASASSPMSPSSSTLAPLTASTSGGASSTHLNSSQAESIASMRQGELAHGLSASAVASAGAKTHGQAALDDHDRFGLFGMLGVIRMADQDSTTLTLGRDLTTLGLSLNSADPLYGAFASPWFEVPTSADIEAEFHVPACYNVQPPPPPQAKLSSVLDETLFYMFYSMPRDALQDAAAIELYNRHWRYHKELRLWLMKDQSSEQSKTPTFERGSYIFFDPSSWEKVKKDFIVMYDALEERRQVNALPSNGASAANAHLAGGSGTISSAVGQLNGLEVGSHVGLLNSLNSTSTPGPTTAQGSHMKQNSGAMNASLHGASSQAFQQQQQQQRQQQQQQQQQLQQQKSLQMMNLGSSGHVPFAAINSHGLNSSKP
ncbi:hypothetical protein BGZ99_007394 [Dissophora globulifera]|uniref:NOT2/NOT3/NOT5 C-terminal domain-containing protein n=1 Tax=Dissophora globulifera TaxID=979702 RepID=A0A9P6RSN2_9FUNG|nr:hypothetical protein BGZ99_007394 [Dissophora globulifera]